MTKEAQFAQAWANCWAEMDALKIPTVRMRREADRFGAVAFSASYSWVTGT